jgi:hypothetical protein
MTLYTSRGLVERSKGPLRVARLPGGPRPVTISVHGMYAMRCPRNCTMQGAIALTSSFPIADA